MRLVRKAFTYSGAVDFYLPFAYTGIREKEMKMDRLDNYMTLRGMGYQALLAWRKARVLVKWEEMEDAGIVRLKKEEERESYWDVYGKPESEKDKRETNKLIERFGCWYVYGEYKCQCCGSWNHGDSIGMVMDPDPLSVNNPYLIDVMHETIRALKGHESNGKDWRVF